MHFNRSLVVALAWIIALVAPGYTMETRTSTVVKHNMSGVSDGIGANRTGFGIEVALSDQDSNTSAEQTALGSGKNTVEDPIAAGPDGSSTSTDGNNSGSGEGQGNCDEGGGQKNNKNPHCAASPSS